MKTWRPDTCGCCIEEIYSDGGIAGGGKVLDKCVAHAAVPDAELYDTILGENRLKNRVYRALVGLDGINFNLSKSTLQADGSTVNDLKDGVQYFWTFSGSGKGRTLAVSISGATLTNAQKTALRNFIDTQFGSGKLSIV